MATRVAAKRGETQLNKGGIQTRAVDVMRMFEQEEKLLFVMMGKDHLAEHYDLFITMFIKYPTTAE